MWPLGARAASADITVRIPETWKLWSALPVVGAAKKTEGPWLEVTLHASDMERAFDCPSLAGCCQVLRWVSLGIQHEIVFDGLEGVEVPTTLSADLARVVEAAAAVFGGKLPYEHYCFLCLMTPDGHGGLEHGDSTILLHSRTEMKSRKGYLDFISLAAHELFHAWNVKRLRPREFVEVDYEVEVYTPFLWLVEGWTAYYDDLLCLRAGVSSVSEYLATVGKNVQALINNPGRLRMSLADSSFDAWIRLYRPDENTKNSSQNYYGNGAIVAMCLDLLVRSASQGARSLDDIIRILYESCAMERGYDLSDILGIVERVGGAKARDFLAKSITGPLDPPIVELLASHGVCLLHKDADLPQLGLQFESGGTVVAAVARLSPAWSAGIMPGDEVIAIQGLRVDSARWNDVFGAIGRVQREIEILIARRGVIKTVRATPMKSLGVAFVELAPRVDEATKSLRDGWLKSLNGSGSVGAPTKGP
jgi:predicted metalloprotease with PDZ domain